MKGILQSSFFQKDVPLWSLSREAIVASAKIDWRKTAGFFDVQNLKRDEVAAGQNGRNDNILDPRRGHPFGAVAFVMRGHNRHG